MSPEIERRAHANHSILLKSIGEAGQNFIAESLGVSEATISRFKSEELQRLVEIATIAGLKFVTYDTQCVPPDELIAIKRFARNYLDIDLERAERNHTQKGS